MATSKILFTANLESFFMKFLLPQLKHFKEEGYEVHIAARCENIDIPFCDKKFDVCFSRGFHIKENLKSLQQMEKILKENDYSIISCHTPFGGAITRLAAQRCKVRTKGTKIFYMVHGFHFFKGAPIINWILYYNVEKYLANYTDTIITINLDDYRIAKKKFKSNIEYVPGVGLVPEKFEITMSKDEKNKYRQTLNLSSTDFVMIYVAELLPRKNQIWLINVVSELLKENKNFHLLLAGKDSMNGKCQKLLKKLNLEEQVHVLGFRKDIPNLLNISDLVISSSKQEGLPVNIMEAMYVGLPIIATNCRGNSDLIHDGKNGFLLTNFTKEEFKEKFLMLYNNPSLKEKFIEEGKKEVQKYLLPNVLEKIVRIYKSDIE